MFIKSSFLVGFVSILLLKCGNVNSLKDSISLKADSSLVAISKYLEEKNFSGKFALRDGEIVWGYSDKRISLPVSLASTLDELEIQGVTREEEFCYFVKGGWKGDSYGYLLTKDSLNEFSGFDSMRFIRESAVKPYKWHKVESKRY